MDSVYRDRVLELLKIENTEEFLTALQTSGINMKLLEDLPNSMLEAFSVLYETEGFNLDYKLPFGVIKYLLSKHMDRMLKENSLGKWLNYSYVMYNNFKLFDIIMVYKEVITDQEFLDLFKEVSSLEIIDYVITNYYKLDKLKYNIIGTLFSMYKIDSVLIEFLLLHGANPNTFDLHQNIIPNVESDMTIDECIAATEANPYSDIHPQLCKKLPLHMLISGQRDYNYNYSKSIKILLQYGADPCMKDNLYGSEYLNKNCISLARKVNSLEGLERFRNVCDYNYLYNSTPFNTIVLSSNDIAYIEYPYHIDDKNTITNIMFAVFMGYQGIVKKYIQSTQNTSSFITMLNHTDNHGCTALHYTALKKNWRIFRLLYEAGADPFLKNNNNETPFQLMNPIIINNQQSDNGIKNLEQKHNHELLLLTLDILHKNKSSSLHLIPSDISNYLKPFLTSPPSPSN